MRRDPREDTRTSGPTTVQSVSHQPQRRYAVLAEGHFGEIPSKTAMGVIRYGHDPVVAVLDSTRAGRNVREWLGDGYDIPVVSTLPEALRYGPTALLIGIAPPGGKLPPSWRLMVLEAIRAGLDIVSGLHEFLGDDPEFGAEARRRRVTIVDHRRPPERAEVASGREHPPGRRVVLTVGTDCAIGKMSVALELRRSAVAAGLAAAFVPTGQTGMMIEGWGAAVDRVVGDFLAGTVEWLVDEGGRRGDWVFVEGQGSIDHPAYSAVTLGLVHGARPHAMVLVHEPGRVWHHGWEGSPPRLQGLRESVETHEDVAGLVAPSAVAAIALSTWRLGESEARRAIAEGAGETGLVCDDPVRYGGEKILDALRERLA